MISKSDKKWDLPQGVERADKAAQIVNVEMVPDL